MFRRSLALAAITGILAIAPALADEAADKAAILARFDRWTEAFNAGNVAGACDLFAPELRYSVPEVLDGTYQTMCGNLGKVLKDPRFQLSYEKPEVHDILIDGDIAIVRLTWTLNVKLGNALDTTREEGMDVFRRGADGRWSIIRYMAFMERPNKLLQ